MPATVRQELGEPTHAKKWYWDANDADAGGTYENPVWIAVNGISSFTPVVTAVKKNNSSYANEGWGSEPVSKRNWGIEATLWRNVDPDDPEEYDRGQEILREASDKFGIGARVDVRYYEMEDGGPRKEAYRGYIEVDWKPTGGTDEDWDSVNVTCGGHGKRNAIDHPEPNS